MTAIYQNWIQKKAMFGWQQYWLLIQSDGMLKLYDNKDLQSVCGKSMNLNEVKILKQSKTAHKIWQYGFKLLFTEKEQLNLSAESSHQREICMNYIRSFVKIQDDEKVELHRIFTQSYTDDYKYTSDRAPNTKKAVVMKTYDCNVKTMFYITHDPLQEDEEFKCKYSTSSNPNIMRTVKMYRILHSIAPQKYSIYIIKMKISSNNNDIVFMQLWRRNMHTQKEKQIYHRNILNQATSNHPITNDNDTYIWNIIAKDVVYILDSKGNVEAISIMWNKSKHLQYHTVVLGEFVDNLFRYLNTRYCAYLVMETLMCVHKLLSDKKQLNLSYESDEPLQMFILALTSRYDQYDNVNQIRKGIVSWNEMIECLIALFVALCICMNYNYEIDKYLDIIYNHMTDIHYFAGESMAKRIECIHTLFGGNQDAMTKIENIFLERKANICANMQQYYCYMLWYNFMCIVHDNPYSNDTPFKPNVLNVILKDKLMPQTQFTLKQLLYLISMDQRLTQYRNRPFCFDVLLMDDVMDRLDNMSLKQKQNALFSIMDTLVDINCLYRNLLQKYQMFIFEHIVISNDYKMWYKFVDYILLRISNDALGNKILPFIFERFCGEIDTIENKEDIEGLVVLYKEHKKYMECDLIQECILENEKLLSKKECISICSLKLRSMKQMRLIKYVELWLRIMSIMEIIDIFDQYKLNWKTLANYLLNRLEKEQISNEQNKTSLLRFKKEGENLRKLVEKLASNNEYKESIHELIEKLVTAQDNDKQNVPEIVYQKQVHQNKYLQNENEKQKERIRKLEQDNKENEKEISEFKHQIEQLYLEINEMQCEQEQEQELKKNENDDYANMNRKSLRKNEYYKEEFKNWYQMTIDIDEYFHLFVENGCDELRFLECFNEERLHKIGINNDIHCKFIADRALEKVKHLHNGYDQEGNTAVM